MHEGKIAEVFVLVDLVDLMRQAGAAPWRQGNGLEMMMPGPAAQDGVRLRASGNRGYE